MQQFIPLFKVKDMRRAIRHYTEVLDFVMTWPDDTPDSPVVDLGHAGEMELQITTHEADRLFGSVVYVWVDDVDALFAKFISRGLHNDKPNSPVHRGPVDQTWGRREFYVTDADGNTLRYCQLIK
ncbi:VOC family protein [Mucilaginibacter mali]|uniref:VOC family protein n=1 Tax=Mucilaginibacter mali TaxID=2740462 RepID=A0A7D4PS87_9SPHI|nr:glyoxalase superfamily protein [Mucilaginibacter mali]QKJ28823.1 VOC family protein [Mucilaginibacter mali]